MEMQPPEPIKLRWELNDELSKIIDEAYHDGLKVVQVSFEFDKDFEIKIFVTIVFTLSVHRTLTTK